MNANEFQRELHDETSQGVTSLMVAMRVLADDADNEAQRQALLASCAMLLLKFCKAFVKWQSIYIPSP